MDNVGYTPTNRHTYTNLDMMQPYKFEVMPFAATWMDLEITILSEVSWTKKDKYHITYMWNLK